MSVTRRTFVRSLGLGTAGAVSALVSARGLEALHASGRDPNGALPPIDPNEIRLDSNENPYGPGPVALDAIKAWFGEAGRYPDVPATDLAAALARFHNVPEDHIAVGAGSGEILRMAAFAFTSARTPLVAALPTYEDPGRSSELIGATIRAVPVDRDLRLDLAGMAREAVGAGLVFLCNPNNPTATVHPASAVADFIKKVNAESPDTIVLVDEAYHHFVEDPGYRSALPLALENPKVLMCRTFSKIYGMAGLRIGYAVGRPETLDRMRRFKLGSSVNVLGAAAAMAALDQTDHLERQRRLNREAREFTRSVLAKMGFKPGVSETNFIMVDIHRDVREFQAACRKLGVAVGRPFPPLLSHARISMGTEDEMRRAVDVIKKVLGVSATVALSGAVPWPEPRAREAGC